MSFGKSDKDIDKNTVAPFLKPTFNTSVGNADTVIGKGSKVVGSLTFSGSAEIHGEVEGEIHAKERLFIGETGVVKAQIIGTEIVIQGTIHGDIFAAKALVLKRPACVTGNIQAALLTVEDGAFFDGKCVMSNLSGSRNKDSQIAILDKSKSAA